LDTLTLGTTDMTTQDTLLITSILQKKGLIGNVSTKISKKKELLLIPYLEEFWNTTTNPPMWIYRLKTDSTSGKVRTAVPK